MDANVAEGGTRDRLLRAATEEFAAHGLAGARVDRIASRAGANKQLVYYYFGSKEGLFDAAVRAMAAALGTPAEDQVSAGLGEWLAQEAETAADAPHWVRLAEFEALRAGEGPVIDEEERRRAVAAAVARIRAEQRSGRLPPDLDPAQLYLAMQALAVYPIAFPQVVRHATGRNPSDPGFRRGRRKFLRELGALVDAGTQAGNANGGARRRATRA